MQPFRRLLWAAALASLVLVVPGGCDPAHRADSDGSSGPTDGAWDGDGPPPSHCDGGPDCVAGCGDGTTNGSEACDDGDGDNTDACPETCQMARCGDGFVWAGHESCDDGNDTPDDGCTACVLDSCGDAVMDPGEECDLGAANSTAGASCFDTCVSTTISLATPLTFNLDKNGAASDIVSLQAADLDGDGRVDLVADSSSTGIVTTVSGMGDGRMWPPHTRATSGSPRDVALGDLDNDGILDAVTVAANSHDASIFLGDGGGFGPLAPAELVPSADSATLSAVVVADINGDGNADILATDRTSNRVFVAAGDGAGGIGPATTPSTQVGPGGTTPVDLALADITGDGIADIVTANEGSDDVSVIPALAGGGFGGAAVYATRIGANGDAPTALAIADVDGDDHVDVVTADRNSDDVVVLKGTAGGALAAPIKFSTLDGTRGDGPADVAVADVTGDGLPDIVTANASHDISILAKSGAGVAFDAPIVLATGDDSITGRGPADVKIADVTGDSIPDILVTSTTSADLSVFVGTGDGGFAAAKVIDVDSGGVGKSPVEAVLADVNGDATTDVVFATQNSVVVAAGFGDGGFALPHYLNTGGQGGSTIIDLNGDGVLDLASPRTSYMVLSYQKAGSFTPTYSSSVSYELLWAAAGDIDDDGDNDLIAIASDYALPFFNDDLAFASVGPRSLPAPGTQVTTADVNGDGVLDILVATPAATAVHIALGDGTGAFGAFTPVTTEVSTSGQQPVYVQTVDVNGDQVIDLLTANRGSNDVSLLIGQGSGGFKAPIIIPAVFGAETAEVYVVRVGDFNRDGLVDLATANLDRGTASIAIGFGDGAFAAPQVFDVGFGPRALAVADFDGDGLDDVAVSGAGGELAVLRGLGSETSP